MDDVPSLESILIPYVSDFSLLHKIGTQGLIKGLSYMVRWTLQIISIINNIRRLQPPRTQLEIPTGTSTLPDPLVE